jgi:hypothetical protein
MLTVKEIQLILERLAEVEVANFGNGYRVVIHTAGYSEDKTIGALQAKLSIMLEMSARREA